MVATSTPSRVSASDRASPVGPPPTTSTSAVEGRAGADTAMNDLPPRGFTSAYRGRYRKRRRANAALAPGRALAGQLGEAVPVGLRGDAPAAGAVTAQPPRRGRA